MYKRLDRAHRAMPLVLGVVTLVSLGVLLAWDVNPKLSVVMLLVLTLSKVSGEHLSPNWHRIQRLAFGRRPISGLSRGWAQ
jgi:hypothetical protein